MPDKKAIVSKKINLNLNSGVNTGSFEMTIESALVQAKLDLSRVDETIESINSLKPECDKLDYILAASSGALCGIIDIFLVGKPGESPIGEITDKWFLERTKDFARLYGWKEPAPPADAAASAIRKLEDIFKVPYDQRGAGDAGKIIFDLNPGNHHFKSLAHNPSLMGLFFSILDQFSNTSHFITDGKLIALQKASDSFELVGMNVQSKFFCAVVNWLGHVISDVNGPSGSLNRGMGIPSPLWTWINDLIVIRRRLNIPGAELERVINELAVKVFDKGFDMRFQTAQLIPVIINELTTRFIYSVRRIFRYFHTRGNRKYSFKELWRYCEPFTNPTVKRMLTVAHGTFCLIDLGDAAVRGGAFGGGSFNAVEFFLHVNIAGVGRFTVALYGEMQRGIQYIDEQRYYEDLQKERKAVEDYIQGLQRLAKMYQDRELLTFTEDLSKSDAYKCAFNKTVMLAEMRKVPENKILRNKADIDAYFRRR